MKKVKFKTKPQTGSFASTTPKPSDDMNNPLGRLSGNIRNEMPSSGSVVETIDDGSVNNVPRYMLNSIGTSGLRRWGNFVFEEFLPHLRHPQAAKVYQEMSDNDPTIGAIIYMTEQLVRNSKWKVTPATGDINEEKDRKENQDVKNALFVEECMHDMSQSWADTICEALSMFVYGWSFHEVIYKVRKGPGQKDGRYRSQYNDGRIGWRNLPARSQHSLYGWEFSDDGGAISMIQMAPPRYERVIIPISKGLLFRTKISNNNPEGRSLLRNAYRPWFFKKRIEEIEGIGIERDLAGLPVLQPPENVHIWDGENPKAIALLAQAEQLVQNVRRDQSEGLVIPHGWEFNLVSTGGSRQFDTNAIINRYDQRIAVTLLSDIVMMGADKVGSFALGDVKQSLMSAAIEAQLRGIADVFNKHAIPTLMHINKLDVTNGYPKLVPDEIEETSVEEIAKVLTAVGLDPYSDLDLYNKVRSIIGIPPINSEQFSEMREKKQQDAIKFEQSKKVQISEEEDKDANSNQEDGEMDDKDKSQSNLEGAKDKLDSDR